jgi:DNA-binding NtrC family response regulator
MGKSILIAEDEQVLRESLGALLEDEGFDVTLAENGARALELAMDRPCDLLMTDIRMPEMDGLELLDRMSQVFPETPVIMLTAFGTVETAVAAMRSGAWDFLLKPVQFDELLLKIRRALEHHDLARRHRASVEQSVREAAFQDIISRAPSMRKLFDQVAALSAIKSTVLLSGESGTGKELFARAIHFDGATRNKPFIAVNCGAIPETLIESELFGHRKGSFTGAIQDKAGFFEAADGGTLMLDEISNLPKRVQGTLLRALEDRTVVRVGDTKPRKVNIRIIAATNRDLPEMVADEEFREDLYYRLAVVTLRLPPLRERREDIPLLTHHFIMKYADAMSRPIQGVSNGVMRALLDRPWRGNVRELENVIEHAMIFATPPIIRLADLPFQTRGVEDDAPDVGEDLKDALREFERRHIIACLERHEYDKAGVAQCLGIGLSSLYRKMDELGIPKSPMDAADDCPCNKPDIGCSDHSGTP